MVSMGTQLCEAFQGDAILIMLEGPTDWDKLKEESDGTMIVVAANHEDKLVGATVVTDTGAKVLLHICSFC